ncbi:P-loop containing nucleoside triphosphate hydrolase protein [Mycena vitilis]|nr:P-loop containing nucleoside triphosphate hydrolase protein [Mycena vitilis]
MTVPAPSSTDSDSGLTGDGAEHGVGLSNPRISASRRQMLDLVNRLHNTGAQIHISLPQIVVIGSQSAGKSSLIESISGITLPRAAGTCTRCPTECRLSHSTSPWKCMVELRFFTDADGQTRGQPRIESFGPPIFDKSQVEERIRRAQRAILHPNKPASTFLEGDTDDSTDVSFSANCISLQISGPEIGDFSKHQGDTDVGIVQGLVTSYISNPSCVILVTVACETDFENQGAYHLAKEYDPAGKRTIGVLTKPDRIAVGDEGSWLPLIRNEREDSSVINWYCVKQPSSLELKQGRSWAGVRSCEQQFFATILPWSVLDPAHKKYLGTSNLIDRLDSILSELIVKRHISSNLTSYELPVIRNEVSTAIKQTRDRIAQLPKPPSDDPVNEISMLLHTFVADLHRMLEGVPRADGLLHSIRPAQERFRREIRRTAPDFRPFEARRKTKNEAQTVYPDPDFLLKEDGYEHLLYWHKDKNNESDQSKNAGPICIDEVLKRAITARTRELPGHYPFEVQKSYIAEFTANWAAPAQELGTSVEITLSRHVDTLIDAHFSAFGQGLLQQRVKFIVHDYISKCAADAGSSVSHVIQLEADGPHTLNDHYLTDYKTKFLAYFKGERERNQNPDLARQIAQFTPDEEERFDEDGDAINLSPIAQILSNLALIGISGVRAEDLTKLLPADGLDPALNIMADVRAYFQVAFKRVVDNVPAAIDHALVRGVGRNLLTKLVTGIGINTPDGKRICEDLAKEDPRVAGIREERTKRLERLEAAKQELGLAGR